MASTTAPGGATSRVPATPTDVVDELFVALDHVARKTLRAAGPRYSPSLDVDAPNLEIVPVHRAASALALGSTFRSRLAALGAAVAGDDSLRSTASTVFARRQITLGSLAADSSTASRRPPDELQAAVRKMRRHERQVREVLEKAIEAAQARIADIERAEDATDADAKRAQAQEKDRLRSRASSLRRSLEPLYELQELLEGAEGSLASERRTMFLKGEWGTGKTHFLCDFALECLADHTPVVVVLANELRDDIDPIDAVAEATGLASSGTELLAQLTIAARANDRRALILIDAINEADRDAWRLRFEPLLKQFARQPDVGLILSCRTPFDEALLTPSTSKYLVPLRHPGFEGQQFDAQIEYFNHYDLPALHVPLLAEEFSRPSS